MRMTIGLPLNRYVFVAMLASGLGMVVRIGAGSAFAQTGTGRIEAKVADLFENRCARAGCHAGPIPQQGMMLTPEQFYASVVSEPSVERPELMRVAPGQPEVSYLMMKIKGAPGIVGAQMPLTGDKLTAEEVQWIADWISSIDTVDETRKKQTHAARVYPFNAFKIVNLPTTRTVEKNSFLFSISHRFNPTVGDGYDAFFGLDGSGIILLGLGYAVTDNLFVNLGRSNSVDDVELSARYLLARQDVDGSWPLDVAVHATINWITDDPPDRERSFGEATKFTAQVTLAREVAPGVGVAVVPGVLFNPAEDVEDEPAVLTIGLGSRWRFSRNMSLLLEWVPIVDGYVRTTTFGNDIRFDSWGAAWEISTGGHVFQIILSNTVGLTTDQYLRGGDLDIEDFDVRLGFQITRILNFF